MGPIMYFGWPFWMFFLDVYGDLMKHKRSRGPFYI